MSPQVDFYLLQPTGDDAAAIFACRLAEKIFLKGLNGFIQTNTQEEALYYDDLLWTFKAGSFIPHGLSQDSEESAPIKIGPEYHEHYAKTVLINLSQNVPKHFLQLARIAEIVAHQESSKQSARARYRFYREQGLNILTHQTP